MKKETILISMTDFVLEQSAMKFQDSGRWDEARWYNSLKYAKFLKQPITIGMFVPTDLEGNVLEEPKEPKYGSLADDWINEQYRVKVAKYQQAKDRVLFQGFKLENDDNAKSNYSKYIGLDGVLLVYWFDSITQTWEISIGLKIVEDLVIYGIQLTKEIV